MTEQFNDVWAVGERPEENDAMRAEGYLEKKNAERELVGEEPVRLSLEDDDALNARLEKEAAEKGLIESIASAFAATSKGELADVPKSSPAVGEAWVLGGERKNPADLMYGDTKVDAPNWSLEGDTPDKKGDLSDDERRSLFARYRP